MQFDEKYFASLAIEKILEREDEKQELSPDEVRLICFNLGVEEFGINIFFVREIINLVPTTPVPHSPEFVLGIINLRGEIFTALDIGLLLGMPPARARIKEQTEERSHLSDNIISTDPAFVIVEIEDKVFCILVDCITGIVNENEAQISPPPVMLEEFNRKVIGEVFKLQERLIMVLDIQELIKYRELEEMEKRDSDRIDRILTGERNTLQSK
jgi:purine-binding chemotaxis protein CheW